MGLFGQSLHDAIHASGENIEMLAEGIIPSQSVTQFFAGDGLGKSTLLVQAELEASAGLPIYGEYEVKRPLKILHIQTERAAREAYQRMIMMMQKIPVNLENFYFEATLQGYDIALPQDRLRIIERLKRVREEFGGMIDWVHIDPIYAWTSADLRGDDGANGINDMIRKIQKDICPTVSYNHHPNRGVRDEHGKRQGEDMYGSRFLSANCTGVFQIESRPGGNGTVWTNRKDSYSCLNKKIELAYDPQFYMSYVDSTKSFSNKSDRCLSFLRICKAKVKAFTFEDFMTENEVSTAYARKQLSRYQELGYLKIDKLNKGKHLYESLFG